MPTTATLQQTCTALAGGGGRIVATITEAGGVTTSLFVFKVADVVANDTYERVAYPFDIATYPEARDATIPYYLQDTVTKDFADIKTAITAKTTFVSSITQALKEYDDATVTFVEVLTSDLSS